MPSPLPGCATPQQLLPLLTGALQLLHSPRVRESDAGARTLQLLATKYLVDLGWSLSLSPEPAVIVAGAVAVAGTSIEAVAGAGAGAVANPGPQQPEPCSSSSSSRPSEQQVVQGAATLLGSLTYLLRQQLQSARVDMAAASRHGLVHGALLCLKYVVEVLPWSVLATSSCHMTLQVSATTAAACGLPTINTNSSSSSSSIEQGQSSSAAVCGPQGVGVCEVAGPAAAVLHSWVAELTGLLTAVAELVRPWLSAQVRAGTAGALPFVHAVA
jgi:hypothetical protein